MPQPTVKSVLVWECCQCKYGPYIMKLYASCLLGIDCNHQRCPSCAIFEDSVSWSLQEHDASSNAKPTKTSTRFTHEPSNAFPGAEFRTEEPDFEQVPTFRPRVPLSAPSSPVDHRGSAPEPILKRHESSTAQGPLTPSEKSVSEAGGPATYSDRNSDEDVRRPSVSKSVAQSADFIVEELSDNDLGDDDLEVIRPDQTEDAASMPDVDGDIIERLKGLTSGDQEDIEQAQSFEASQREAYLRRRKRWSNIGYNKRTHDQSISHEGSDDSDVESLGEDQFSGASSRRLRRKTRPNTSSRLEQTLSMFENPPSDLEELNINGRTSSARDDSDGTRLSDDEEAEGTEDTVLLLPQWLMDQRSESASAPPAFTPILSEHEMAAVDELLPPLGDPSPQESVAHANSTSRPLEAEVEAEVHDDDGIDSATPDLNAAEQVDQDSISDAETCYADSVASIPYSNWSRSTIAADDFLADELADFLWLDANCHGLAVAAVSKPNIGRIRFERNFRRLLRAFAMDIAYEATSKDQHAAATFVRLSAAAVASNISTRAECQRTALSEPIVDDRESQARRQVADQVVYDQQWQENADSDDEDFTGHEAAEEDHYNLAEAKHFLSRSQAKLKLHENLREFVCPSFHSILSTIAQKEFDEEEVTCCLSELLNELAIANPDTIIFTNSQPGLVDIARLKIELRTGQEWDWWPCPPPREPLRENWIRVEWQTTFGLACWRNIPFKYSRVVDRALKESRVNQSIIEADLPRPRIDELHTRASTQVKQDSPIRNLPLWAQLCTSWKSLLRSANGGQNQGPGSTDVRPATLNPPTIPGSSNGAATTSTASGISAGVVRLGDPHSITITASGQSNPPVHVLLLVRTSMSEDYDLSQIKLPISMTTPEFFKVLRKTYLRSRGFARHFSVWKYYHCDFYRSIRFLPAKFTPHAKNNLPPKDHPDYRICDTARTRDPPPILPIEFYYGYYLSNRSVFAWLSSLWRRSGRQQDAEQKAAPQLQLRPDILRLLPRKVTQLDEAGVTREDFWNILAVEKPCLRWVVFWNFICISPAVGFFFLWLFKLGGVADLQNASVPITIVIMLEGLFWTLLWASTWEQPTTSGLTHTH